MDEEVDKEANHKGDEDVAKGGKGGGLTSDQDTINGSRWLPGEAPRISCLCLTMTGLNPFSNSNSHRQARSAGLYVADHWIVLCSNRETVFIYVLVFF